MSRSPGKRVNRREFLRGTAATAATLVAAPTIITSSALGANGRPPASERIVMGNIGYGGRASGVLDVFMAQPDVQVVGVCDVKQQRRELGKKAVDNKYGNRDCQAYLDLFEILARDDIDAMLVATGDYWHSLAACLTARAGKDMYCEKPLSVVIAESRAVADTMRRFGRVFQCGTQRRSVDQFVFAMDLARRGLLGELKTLYAETAPAWLEPYETRLPAEPEPAREEFWWDRWLGPALWRPYNHQYASRGFWSGHWDFSGGSITEWGSHTVDLCQFANDADDTSPVEYWQEGPDVHAHYANGIKLVLTQPIGQGSCGVRFEGTEGWVEVDDSGHLEVHPKSLRPRRGLGKGYPVDNHVRNFLDCVKTRQQTVADAEGAHRSITACHAANICKRLGRPLRWDPAKEEFIGDDQANRMRTRAYRQPWRL
ncbi:MAG: Gfo/Idh/MocA family oxidoreductase [Sedimentisphaerales bacterium]|nr:Gfo/Idh/MocA family oxidoreductase [Sedimentisphaerales bacterium]